jgi:hypothetical protein
VGAPSFPDIMRSKHSLVTANSLLPSQMLSEESTASVAAIRAAMAGGFASAAVTLSRMLLHATLGWLLLAPACGIALAAALGAVLQRRRVAAAPRGRGALRGARRASGVGAASPGAKAAGATPRRRVAFAPSPPASPRASPGVRASPRIAARRRTVTSP